MKINKVLFGLCFALILAGCTLTGLGPATLELERNLSENELNELLSPEITRGTEISYSYKPVSCVGNDANNFDCTNLDLITDAGVEKAGNVTSFNNETENTSSYYLLMNKNGNCLSSVTDDIKVTDCDPTSDYQKFRFSYIKAERGVLEVADSPNYYTRNRYHYNIIPKKKYDGKDQIYGSTSNPEASWLYKKTDEDKIQHDTGCSSSNSKCIFYFFDASSIDSSLQYTLDGSTGDYFFIQNEKHAQDGDAFNSNDRDHCLAEYNGKIRVSADDDLSRYDCTRKSSKLLWRVMKIVETT